MYWNDDFLQLDRDKRKARKIDTTNPTDPQSVQPFACPFGHPRVSALRVAQAKRVRFLVMFEHGWRLGCKHRRRISQEARRLGVHVRRARIGRHSLAMLVDGQSAFGVGDFAAHNAAQQVGALPATQQRTHQQQRTTRKGQPKRRHMAQIPLNNAPFDTVSPMENHLPNSKQ